MTASLNIRKGRPEDADWLYQLFRAAMQRYIDKAWGWDELLQREGFITSLPATSFRVLERESAPVGSYHLSEKPEVLILDMILVDADHQGRGLGSFMMREIQSRSKELAKPVELSVLKINPARAFHEALGFCQMAEEEHSVRMRWS